MNFVFSLQIAVLSQRIFAPIIFVLSLFMVLLILVQRGKGGGLTGALGGPGGQSAFGTKAGDLFTRITIVTAAIWIFLLGFTVWWYTESGFSDVLADSDAPNTPSMGASPTAGLSTPPESAAMGVPVSPQTGSSLTLGNMTFSGNATGSGNATAVVPGAPESNAPPTTDAPAVAAELSKDDLPATTPAEPKMPAEPASTTELKTEPTPSTAEPKTESPAKTSEPKIESEPKAAEPKVEPAPSVAEPNLESPKIPSTEK